MLQIKHLTLTHRKDLRILIDDFSFVLNPGDKAVLIGEEGNGKSTLLKWIFDPALTNSYCEWSGERAGDAGPAGYLAQELDEEEKTGSIYDFCAASPGFFDLSPKELAGIARQLRFPAEEFYSDRAVGTLSGGEQIKLQLGRLLFQQPSLLLLDEPSSDLDLDTLLWLESFINHYQGILLYISHDETLIENTANLILHIEHPREGKPPRCTAHRLCYQDYIRQREDSINSQTREARKEREEYDKKMEKFRRVQQSVEHAQNAVSRQNPGKARLLKKKMHAVLSMGRRFDREAENMTRLPEVEQAVFLRFPPDAVLPAGKIVLDMRCDELFAGEKFLAKNIRLRVMGGEKVGILGQNGVGKTTFLRLAAEELLKRQDVRAAYMSQNYAETLPLEQTPLEYLAQDGSVEAGTRARTFLGSMRYARQEMLHPVRELSGGQRAKLLLTKMMLDGVNVLILDEPTRNFSPMSGPQVRQALSDFRGTIISVSHDRKYLSEVCDRLYRFTENGLQEIRPDDLLSQHRP
ncbi:MAG: ATP-binding cassette domain-containing protein [Oscillospiraceae bacterium]|nr:ATP-binding cassette domain-containing protein [Oscillospiraceae bacterium]